MSGQMPRGSGSPAGTGRQRPRAPAVPHEVQAPLQSDSQQTPSTQCPLAHSVAVLHAVPFAAGAVPLVPPVAGGGGAEPPVPPVAGGGVPPVPPPDSGETITM